ncbi:cryptochrome/photolyase family protein [Mangrovivirga sp. M17]|uniref:Cryptochrome/photolyase family protein n=1 Tax=Mangrovivirga halotolerans TaxID=2993936 RepID=A0ABT3RSH3_9BACT|nr:cryptochrome/photolyase family protein [Mangrovivirga halotolerans]MCX2744740.1 cryptochrome/photolyase family protein [Mangrovivirga halotolerans]
MSNKKFKRLALIAGDSLYDHDFKALSGNDNTLFFMAEDYELCTHFNYHKQKLIYFLSTMRNHRDELKSKGIDIKYYELSESNKHISYTEKITKTLDENPSISTIVSYEISDKFFEKSIIGYCNSKKLTFETIPSPKFLFSRDDFKNWLDNNESIRMQNYYIEKRKELNILVEDGSPRGNKWSFDAENRKKIPKGLKIPDQIDFENQEHVSEAQELIERIFNKHPGSSKPFKWAVTRKSAKEVLKYFIEEKLDNFGPYQDGILSDNSFLFHSTLSPYLNSGLLTPEEVLDSILDKVDEVTFSSIEGFVRQIIGWREFMHGMYQNKDMNKNFWKHKGKLKKCWYDGTTGIQPVDDCIRKVNEQAYLHHIERLMIMGNIMLLSEVDPDECYRWFMEMFIDSADWVMAGNVYSMSQFADGGLFATKPYISGSNYIKKMSDYGKSDWNEIFDGLYWRFIDKHRDFFSSNPRLSMMVSMLDKKSDMDKRKLFDAAEKFIANTTY